MKNLLIINANDMLPKKFRIELFVLIISTVITILLYLKTDVITYDHPHFKHFWDHHKYIWMALHNLDFHIAPFCWRIFVPFFASILPFELAINFKIIALFAVTLTGFFVFKIGQKIFNETYLSLALMFSYFSVSYVTKYVIYDFWLPDAFAYLLITIGIYSIIIRNDVLFLTSMILGALTKESVLFVLPLYYSFNASKFIDIKILKKTIYLSLIPLLVFFAIRILIPSLNENQEYLISIPEQLRNVQNDSSSYNLKYLLTSIGLKRINEFSLYFLYRITVYSFLVYFILALIDWAAIKKWLPKFLPLIILSYLQIFFALNEERLVVFAHLPVIILSVYGLKKILAKSSYIHLVLPLTNLILLFMVINSGIFYGDWLIIRQIVVLVVIYLLVNLIPLIKMKLDGIKVKTKNTY